MSKYLFYILVIYFGSSSDVQSQSKPDNYIFIATTYRIASYDSKLRYAIPDRFSHQLELGYTKLKSNRNIKFGISSSLSYINQTQNQFGYSNRFSIFTDVIVEIPRTIVLNNVDLNINAIFKTKLFNSMDNLWVHISPGIINNIIDDSKIASKKTTYEEPRIIEKTFVRDNNNFGFNASIGIDYQINKFVVSTLLTYTKRKSNKIGIYMNNTYLKFMMSYNLTKSKIEEN